MNLISLPNEVLSLIIDHLQGVSWYQNQSPEYYAAYYAHSVVGNARRNTNTDHQQDMFQLMRTCKRFHELVAPALWRAPNLRPLATPCQWMSFLDAACLKGPTYASNINHIEDVWFYVGGEDFQNLEVLVPLQTVQEKGVEIVPELSIQKVERKDSKLDDPLDQDVLPGTAVDTDARSDTKSEPNSPTTQLSLRELYAELVDPKTLNQKVIEPTLNSKQKVRKSEGTRPLESVEPAAESSENVPTEIIQEEKNVQASEQGIVKVPKRHIGLAPNILSLITKHQLNSLQYGLSLLLAQSTNLKILRLHLPLSLDVTPADIGLTLSNLPNLSVLDLAPRIDDTALKLMLLTPLQSHNLRALILRSPRLTDVGLELLSGAFPNLSALIMPSYQQSQTLHSFGGATRRRSYARPATLAPSFTHEGMARLAPKLSKLRVLDMSAVSLDALESDFLQQDSVIPPVLAAISQLLRLQSLTLTLVPIVGVTLESIKLALFTGNSTHLVSLTIKSNPTSTTTVEENELILLGLAWREDMREDNCPPKQLVLIGLDYIRAETGEMRTYYSLNAGGSIWADSFRESWKGLVGGQISLTVRGW